MKKLILALGAATLLTGCILPSKPGRSVVSKSTDTGKYVKGEWHYMATYKKKKSAASRSVSKFKKIKRYRNLLLIAADDKIGKRLEPEIQKRYKGQNHRLEDILWWHYAPKIQKTYNYVLRIHWDGFNINSLKSALMALEKMKTPYDVMLLAHGIPNHLLASPGQGVISYEDIESIPRLKYANTLYLQACFGDTLVKDFINRGFQTAIASTGFNINFFYPDFYLDSLAKYKGDSVKAHYDVVNHLKTKFQWSPMNKKLLEVVFKDDPNIQGDLDNYLEVMEPPKIWIRKR